MLNTETLSREVVRNQDAIRIISRGLVAAVSIVEIILFIYWCFNPDFPILPVTILAAVAILSNSITYWRNRSGHVLFSSYFLVTSSLIEASLMTSLLGGYTGPIAITYLLPILMSGIVISVRATFLTATMASLLYLALIPLEQSGIIPQLIAVEGVRETQPALTVTVLLAIFYLAALLSWFAARSLNQSLEDLRQYASELQTTNEKLQASEEELRTANEELRAIEEELRASNEELNAANHELREAQEQLVRSERLAAIGQLAGGVGHELRNPLGAIKNAVYYIRGKLQKNDIAGKEPRVLEFLDIVDEEINASDKIINDLLGFSRVARPATLPADIKKVINDALAAISIPQGISVIQDFAAELPDIEIDADQVRQVLMNLLTNAIQAMPQGGQLTVSARSRDHFLEVSVTDTGCGISRGNISKVFEPLFTTRAKGIGLGLAVSRTIIERHLGKITAESDEGKGSTFRIELPLKSNTPEENAGGKNGQN
ncbi:MAG: ATP-binding protein [Dehalococcoidales bacterium]|jgi:signal transduction histidine kinase